MVLGFGVWPILGNLENVKEDSSMLASILEAGYSWKLPHGVETPRLP